MQPNVRAGFKKLVDMLTAHREKATLPIGFLPGLARGSEHDLTETDAGSDQGSYTSIASAGHASNHGELLTCKMPPADEAGFAGGFRNFSLGIGDNRDGSGVQGYDGPGILGGGWNLSCSTGQPVLFASQFGTPLIMPGDEGPQDHGESEFFQVLLPLSSSTSEASSITSAPRDHARHGLRGDRIGEAAHPGPDLTLVRTWRYFC